jgi:hypothetical protein
MVGPKEFGEAGGSGVTFCSDWGDVPEARPNDTLLLPVGPGGLGPDAPLRWQWASCRPFSGGVTQVGHQCSYALLSNHEPPATPAHILAAFEWPTMAKGDFWELVTLPLRRLARHQTTRCAFPL